MKKSTIILVSTLAITFLLMLVFIFTRHGGNTEQIIPAIFLCIALVVIAIISLRVEKKIFLEKNIPKIIIGSFALAFGVMLLVGVLALPFVGFSGLDIIMGQYTGIIWLVFTLALSPITAKYLK